MMGRTPCTLSRPGRRPDTAHVAFAQRPDELGNHGAAPWSAYVLQPVESHISPPPSEDDVTDMDRRRWLDRLQPNRYRLTESH